MQRVNMRAAFIGGRRLFLRLAAAFIQFIICASSKPAASPAMIDLDCIHCMKKGGIAEAA